MLIFLSWETNQFHPFKIYKMKSNSKTSSQKVKSSQTNGKNGHSSSSGPSDQSTGLRKLFENELKDIYWAEKALLKAIPKMAKKATADDLVSALKTHLSETEGQVKRLEQVFDSIGTKAVAKKCEAMDGLIKEAEEIMEETAEGVVRDAGIISAAQKVEHYEIATYGTLCAFAKTLGEDDAAALLHETLEEERGADEKLSSIAESFVNTDAADEDHEEHDGEVPVMRKRK
jgi:ferritin-like metal-binding protein YciE